MKIKLLMAQKVRMPAGSVVEVDEGTANWLIGVGAAEKAQEVKEAKEAKPKKAKK